MWWDEEFREEEEEEEEEVEEEEQRESPVDFDFFSLLSKPKDYYKILEVDYDATEEIIRSNYIRLALKWHPDKKKEESATSRFQEINEAYKVLSDPVKRREYDEKGVCVVEDYNAIISNMVNQLQAVEQYGESPRCRYPAWAADWARSAPVAEPAS
ncbi:uncharacterized protein LOC103991290 isoform X1 [Musa acuminata AAA Group]|uniref:uncharacterized protein LOC103991290 isoform X1 n=1 Tax=Musa acuminata AAA Group TaxID=214697 RepID=UPI0031D51A7B